MRAREVKAGTTVAFALAARITQKALTQHQDKLIICQQGLTLPVADHFAARHVTTTPSPVSPPSSPLPPTRFWARLVASTDPPTSAPIKPSSLLYVHAHLRRAQCLGRARARAHRWGAGTSARCHAVQWRKKRRLWRRALAHIHAQPCRVYDTRESGQRRSRPSGLQFWTRAAAPACAHISGPAPCSERLRRRGQSGHRS